MVARKKQIAAVLFLAWAAPAQTVKVRLATGVEVVEMDEYVGWVLAGEAGGLKSGEALKAMAVVARTYARFNLGRHKAQGFDYCETTHCQDARKKGVTARLRAAVEETSGITLWWKGRTAQVFYTGHCGGKVEAAGALWPGAARPYLQGHEDGYCVGATAQRWTARVGWKQLEEALGLKGLTHMEVAARTASGRARTLRTNAGPVSAERLHIALGRRHGWNLLRSRLYEIAETAAGAEFRGSGTGHGAGFCQMGADERGKAGQKWEEILAAYFPGLRAGVSARDIEWRVVSGERVEVWTAGVGMDAGLAERALVEAERRSGLRGPRRVEVRVYPDVAVYRDATGASGRMAAITRGRVVHLQPVRGGLEQTLLHEMLHVVIGENARRALPLWFEEGLADVLGDGRTHPVERARVEALIKQKGRAAVLKYLETGIR